MFCINLLYQLKYLSKKFVNLIYKNRHYWKNMDFIDLRPPKSVCGMTVLEKDLFNKMIKVPQLRVPEEKSNEILPFLKRYLLKMEKIKPVFSNIENPKEKIILLHPSVESWENLPKEELSKKHVTEECFQFGEIELKYENWKADELLKAILPKDSESLTSYSKIGHILHVNLKDHLLPYKKLIGEILSDKIPACRTVVNKSQSIDNTYRNFALELIYGEADYCVETKENGTTFQFDFSKVYWNPRLSTEHERIIKMLKFGDTLYDVFAGVGPFSIPAAKKKCSVLANDLNPESYMWLNKNIKINKCNNNIETFNKDGRDFILEIIKNDISQKLVHKGDLKTSKIHITMNLPAKAVEFLDAFQGLLVDKTEIIKENLNWPLIHVYCFIKGPNDRDSILNYIEESAGYKIRESLEGIHFVRNVAPNKNMYRISFNLTKNILFEDLSISKRKQSAVGDEFEEKSKKLRP